MSSQLILEALESHSQVLGLDALLDEFSEFTPAQNTGLRQLWSANHHTKGAQDPTQTK